MKEPNISFSDIRKRRRQKKFFIKLSLFIFLFILLIFGSIQFIFYSSFFRFDKVIVNGGENTDKEKLLALLRVRIDSSSFIVRSLGFYSFLAWPNNLGGENLNSLPSIESLKITKDRKNKTLIIDISEKKPLGVWCLRKVTVGNPCYWFDEKGVVFKETLAPGGNLIKVVNDYFQTTLEPGSKVLPASFVDNFLSIINVLSQVNLSIKEINLNDLNLEELEVVCENGPKIYFSLRYPSNVHAEVIRSLSQNPNFKNYHYIDLRVENKVFYQ